MASHTPAPGQFGQQFPAARPSPSPVPLTHQNSYGSHGSHGSAAHQPVAHTPSYQQAGYTPQYTSGATPVAQHANPMTNYGHYQDRSSVTPVRTSAPAQTPHITHNNAYNPPRPIEVYTLPEQANFAIPADIRNQFQRDDYDKVLFFTAPPLEANPVPEEKRNLSHSLRYLADKARAREEENKKRKAREAELEAEATAKAKRVKADLDSSKSWLMNQKLSALEIWTKHMETGTDELYQQLYGENWKQIRDSDLMRLGDYQKHALEKSKELVKFRQESKAQREVKLTGFKWI
jgi:chromatin structure-remodeling complex subunit RSC1/2